MQSLKQIYTFSTNVTGSTDVNEFVIEFFDQDDELECIGNPVKVTKNFDELLDFLDQMEN